MLMPNADTAATGASHPFRAPSGSDLAERRILFVAEATSVAHVERMLALARALDRSRFTPLFAWHPRFNASLGPIDEEFYPLFSLGAEELERRRSQTRITHDFATLEIYVAWELEIFREAQPDLVVGFGRFSLPTSTELARLPYINVINAHWSPHAERIHVPGPRSTKLLGRRLAQSIADRLRPPLLPHAACEFNRFAKRFGRPSAAPDLRAALCEGTRVLYAELPMVTPTPGRPPSHRDLGPLRPPVQSGRRDALDAIPTDLPWVYLTPQVVNHAHLQPRLMEALATLPVRAIVATAGARLVSPSSNVHFVAFPSFAEACRRAMLVVCDGSPLDAQQAMLEGTPVLGLPSDIDAFLQMAFAQKAGIARSLRADTATAAELARVIAEMLATPRHREAAQAAAAAARRFDAGRILGETIDELLVERTRSAPAAPGTAEAGHPDPALLLPIDTPQLAHELARAALVAPSAGNSQPWRFAWDGELLHISIDPTRIGPVLDYVSDDLGIALGAALANMEAVAARRGKGLWTDIFPRLARDGLWASVGLTATPGPHAPLAEAVTLRHTHRGAYQTSPLTADERGALQAWADVPGVRLQWIEGPSALSKAAHAMALFEQMLLEIPGIQRVFQHWIRLSKDDEFSLRDGLGKQSLRLGRGAAFMLPLVFTALGTRLVTALRATALVRGKGQQRIARSGAIGVLTIDAPTQLGFIEAGRALERIWLEAARRGLAMHPLAGLLLLDQRFRFAGGSGFTPRQYRLVDAALREMAAVAPEFSSRTPAMLFRIGRAAPEIHRSLRLPLERVLVDRRIKAGTFLPAVPVARKPEGGAGVAGRSQPRRVLFVGEAVTVTHVGRMFRLANQLDPERFKALVAWDPRYNQLLGPMKPEFYPTYSISPADFMRRLYEGKPAYSFETLARYVSWDLEVLRAARPDVVVGDYRLSLATSTMFAGIPYVNVMNAHWSPYAQPRFQVPESAATHRMGVAIPQFVFDVSRPFFFRAFADDFNRLNEKFGRPSFGSDLRGIYCYGDRVLYPDLAEIVPLQGASLRHRFLGPVVWSPDLPIPDWLAGRLPHQKTVYLNMGTSGNPELVPDIVKALLARKLRVIAATGKHRLAITSPDLFTTDFISGDAACAAADIVIFNGGSAGGHQAMLAGVPVIGIASNLDQFLNMHYVEKAGLGLLVRSDRAKGATVGRAVDEILQDSRFIERSRRMAARASTYDSAAILQQTLDDVLADQPIAEPPVALVLPAAGVACSVEVVRQIVKAATWAPTVSNSQPFRFVWDGRRLAVHVQPERLNPQMHFLNSDTWIDVGTTLANVSLEATCHGLTARVMLVSENSHDALVAYVTFDASAAPPDPLAAHIEARCTNRRPYATTPLTDDEQRALKASVESFSSTQVDWITDLEHRGELARALTAYYQVLFENKGMLASFLAWVRPGGQNPPPLDGMSMDTMELGRWGKWFFLLGASPRRAALLARLRFFKLFSFGSARRIQKSAAFGLLSLPLYDVAGLVEGGIAMQTLWLEATRLGLAFEPLAGAGLLMQRVNTSKDGGLSPRHRRLAHRAIATLTAMAPAFTERAFTCFFRIGHAEAPTARAMRLPVDAVFTDKSSRTTG